MSALTINQIDTELNRCQFCAALCDDSVMPSGCTNKPIHRLKMSCLHVLRSLAKDDCATCEGTGVAYRHEDRCPIEGDKMSSKKYCGCVMEAVL